MELRQKILQKKAKIAICGLGYVGLPLAVELAKVGFSVFGLDMQKDKVKQVNQGKSYISDVISKELKNVVSKGKLKATLNSDILGKTDVIIICVPTPLTKHKEPDISYVKAVTQDIAKNLKKGQLIILESTTYPGTTREVILPALTKSGLKAGKDFYLAFSPERVDPGNKKFKTKDIPKVVGGMTKKCTDLAALVYSSFIKQVHQVSSPEAAEMTKLLENIFRIVNISAINELALLCDRMKIDIWEVIEAAKTKPYGFMAFYPGPGIGGHCFNKHQWIHIKENGKLKTIQIRDLFNHLSQKNIQRQARGKTILLFPKNLEVLSFDLERKKSLFKKICILSCRPSYNLLEVKGAYRYALGITDRHPLVVCNSQEIKVKFPKEIEPTDKLVILSSLPQGSKRIFIDLIKYLPKNLYKKIRVKPNQGQWKDFKTVLNPYLTKNERKWDYLRDNFLPLTLFLKAEKKLPVKRKDIYLCTGRGPSFSKIKAKLEIDGDFARLIGYYLSEGCLTQEKKTKRVRFTFSRDEKEYIRDLKNILEKFGIKYSEYFSKRWKSYHLKVSSEIFGVLFKNILDCGTNCYNMQIPSQVLLSNSKFRKEVLTGLLRGDGGVYYSRGKRAYIKNGKQYKHNYNSACVCYFTSSPKLFEQIQLLLHELGIAYILKPRKGLLNIHGYRNIKKLEDIFLGEKEKKINLYLKNNKKKIDYKNIENYKNFASLKINSINKKKADYVYSLEVKDTNTLVTSSGIIAHNCIPLDPFYLSWRAKEHDFYARFIELAGEINDMMPHYVVTKVAYALNQQRKPIAGSKILVLGVAYKKNIGDVRESPVLKIIQELLHKKAKVLYHDPYIPQIKLENKILNSSKLSNKLLGNVDCVLVATDHSVFDFNKIAEQAKLIVDTRNGIKKRGLKHVYRI